VEELTCQFDLVEHPYLQGLDVHHQELAGEVTKLKK
jgi:hypothetical protein